MEADTQVESTQVVGSEETVENSTSKEETQEPKQETQEEAAQEPKEETQEETTQEPKDESTSPNEEPKEKFHPTIGPKPIILTAGPGNQQEEAAEVDQVTTEDSTDVVSDDAKRVKVET